MELSLRYHHFFYICCTAYIVILVQPATAGLVEKNIVTCRNDTTQVLVNQTKLEFCYQFCVWNCYCNITRERPVFHTTTICEEDDGRSGENQGDDQTRKLTDPELSAIAFIASLVFSVLISLTVFLIQRRTRAQRALPHTLPHVKSMTNDVGPPVRYIIVQPANHIENVYEDVSTTNHRSGHQETVTLLGGAGEEVCVTAGGAGEVQYIKSLPDSQFSTYSDKSPVLSTPQQPNHYLNKSGTEGAPVSDSQVITESTDPASPYFTTDGEKRSVSSDHSDTLPLQEIVYENINHPDVKISDL